MATSEGSLIGRQLGDFQIQALLGTGGMAEVYRALDLRLRREVAVKVLPENLAADPAYVARFRTEAQRVAALNHPHIVPIYHYGEENGLLYIVMPVLRESLRDKLTREGRIAQADAVHITAEIASALDAAHEAGLVHRDVKPENILLDAKGNAQLTDFGIAREADFLRRPGAVQTLAATGLPVGTPEYMAPEQLRSGPVDQRADIYGLGAVLYEMLTGVVPHEAATPYEVAALVLTSPLIPPSRHNPEIRPAIEDVVLRALAKHPEDRYPDARAFAEALVVALNEPDSVSVPAVGAWPRRTQRLRQTVRSVPPEPFPSLRTHAPRTQVPRTHAPIPQTQGTEGLPDLPDLGEKIIGDVTAAYTQHDVQGMFHPLNGGGGRGRGGKQQQKGQGSSRAALLIVLVIILLFIGSAAGGALVLSNNLDGFQLPWVAVAQPTATLAPTATFSDEPTATLEPIGTATAQPTSTAAQPTNTAAPKPSATPQPTPTNTPQPTPTNTPFPTGTGLTGKYYNTSFNSGCNPNINGSPNHTHTDDMIDFTNWGSSAPYSDLGTSYFAVRWTGYILPKYSEEYTFYTHSDDGVRVTVNGQTIINNWGCHADTTDNGKITLTAGTKYTIQVDYFQASNSSIISLSWQSNHQAQEIVPQSALFPN